MPKQLTEAIRDVQSLACSEFPLAGGRRPLETCKFWMGQLAVVPHNSYGDLAGEACGVLTYHRTAPLPATEARPTYNVTPARLRRQLDGLLRRGFEPWSLGELVAQLEAGRTLPERKFLVTFDDGFANVHRFALPVLREFSIPAVVFLATSYLDQRAPFPFDDWALAGSSQVDELTWRPLTSNECEEMLDSGLIEFGTHTHTHLDFLGNSEQFAEDVACSLDVLQRRFGVQRAGLSYPFGHVDPDLKLVADQLGTFCGFSTESTPVMSLRQRYGWGRFTAESYDSPGMLGAKLGGWYSLIRDSLGRCGEVARSCRRWLSSTEPTAT